MRYCIQSRTSYITATEVRYCLQSRTSYITATEVRYCIQSLTHYITAAEVLYCIPSRTSYITATYYYSQQSRLARSVPVAGGAYSHGPLMHIIIHTFHAQCVNHTYPLFIQCIIRKYKLTVHNYANVLSTRFHRDTVFHSQTSSFFYRQNGAGWDKPCPHYMWAVGWGCPWTLTTVSTCTWTVSVREWWPGTYHSPAMHCLPWKSAQDRSDTSSSCCLLSKIDSCQRTEMYNYVCLTADKFVFIFIFNCLYIIYFGLLFLRQLADMLLAWLLKDPSNIIYAKILYFVKK